MNITINKNNDISTVLINEKRLDASLAPEFKSQMDTLIDEGQIDLILDLNKVSFMDSSSLGALVAVYKKVVANKGSIKLTGVTGVVADLFKITRMDTIFTIQNESEAKAEATV